jgi:hypothetical protein
VPLDGTVVDGDIDLANKAAHIVGGMPGLQDMSGEMIIIDPYTYYRTYGQTQYAEGDDSGLAVNPALPSGAAYIIEQVLAIASDPSLSPTLVGIESTPSGSAYHVRVSLSSDAVNSKLSSFGKAFGGGQLDLWIMQDGYWLERLEFSTPDPTIGPGAIRIEFSKWNDISPIEAPPAVQLATPGA